MLKSSTANVCLVVLLFLCFFSTHLLAQTVGGSCINGSVNLTNAGTLNGKDSYSGTGTAGGTPNVLISIYWLGAPDNVWLLAFNGQPLFYNSAATTLMPCTSSGGWTAVYEETCSLTGLNIACGGALAVEFLSVKAVLTTQKQTLLTWETASEHNNKGFEVQRSSEGKNWSVLVFFGSTGTTKQRYAYTDQQPLVDVNYYRLNQIDQDGKTSLSSTVTVSNNQKAYFSIAPNPTNGPFLINTNGVKNESPLSVSLYNMFGQVIFKKQTEQGQAVMDLTPYPVGTYIVEISYQNEIQRSKVVKQ